MIDRTGQPTAAEATRAMGARDASPAGAPIDTNVEIGRCGLPGLIGPPGTIAAAPDGRAARRRRWAMPERTALAAAFTLSLLACVGVTYLIHQWRASVVETWVRIRELGDEQVENRPPGTTELQRALYTQWRAVNVPGAQLEPWLRAMVDPGSAGPRGAKPARTAALREALSPIDGRTLWRWGGARVLVLPSLSLWNAGVVAMLAGAIGGGWWLAVRYPRADHNGVAFVGPVWCAWFGLVGVATGAAVGWVGFPLDDVIRSMRGDWLPTLTTTGVCVVLTAGALALLGGPAWRGAWWIMDGVRGRGSTLGPGGTCRSCGYLISGGGGACCPECGGNPRAPRTIRPPSPRSRLVMELAVFGVLAPIVAAPFVLDELLVPIGLITRAVLEPDPTLNPIWRHVLPIQQAEHPYFQRVRTIRVGRETVLETPTGTFSVLALVGYRVAPPAWGGLAYGTVTVVVEHGAFDAEGRERLGFASYQYTEPEPTEPRQLMAKDPFEAMAWSVTGGGSDSRETRLVSIRFPGPVLAIRRLPASGSDLTPVLQDWAERALRESGYTPLRDRDLPESTWSLLERGERP